MPIQLLQILARLWSGRSYTAWICLVLISLTSLPSLGQYSRHGLGQTKQNPLWVYEAELEDGTTISYALGKYRIVKKQSTNTGTPITTIYLFDDSRPPIAWIYDAQQHTASITTATALYNFARLANRDGASAMQQRYHVPERLLKPDLLRGQRSLLNSSFHDMPALCFIIDSTARYYQKTGVETIAGQKCIKYQHRDDFGGVARYWVEPKSHLALKVENVISNGLRAAPTRILFVTKTIKFLRSLPPERFQLPSGTTAFLPEAMKDIPLPPGVIRKPMRGEEALLGFNPQTLFQPQQPSSGTEGGVRLVK